MSDTSGDVARLLGRTSLNGSESRCHETTTRGIASQRESLHDATRSLETAAEEVAAQAQKVLSTGLCGPVSQDLSDLHLLTENATKIADIGTDLRAGIVDYVWAFFAKLDSEPPNIRRLLIHFGSAIKARVTRTLETPNSHANSLHKLLEDCYQQAYSKGGSLHVDNFFVDPNKRSLVSSRDHDCDHARRWDTQIRYAGPRSTDRSQQFNNMKLHRREMNQDWIAFWVRRLHICVNGPTLFWPLSDDSSNELLDRPRFLYRAFDGQSSGTSNDTIVASAASQSASGRPRHDLLSLSSEQICRKLCDHLMKKGLFSADSDDDLMSWSNSLLFVVQYAIYRSQWRNPSEVNVCVVDPTEFPVGQFARDRWLFEQCYRPTEGQKDPEMENLIGLREGDYDNGEYLSQGTLYHGNRSRMVTLDELICAGLCKLYPEFGDDESKRSWTKRVRHLRRLWADPCSTTSHEVQLAYSIATTTSFRDEPQRFVLALLMFKNRQVRNGDGVKWLGPQDNARHHGQEIAESCDLFTAYLSQQECHKSRIGEPDEVQRFQEAMEEFDKAQNRADGAPLLSRLEAFFVCP